MKRILLLMVVLLLVSGCNIGQEGQRQTAKKIEAQSVSYQMTSVALYQEYDANQVAADQKYKGKVLEVSGPILRIGKDIMDVPYVILNGDGLSGIQCSFANENEVAKLGNNQQITVHGQCDGMIIDVQLEGCTLK